MQYVQTRDEPQIKCFYVFANNADTYDWELAFAMVDVFDECVHAYMIFGEKESARWVFFGEYSSLGSAETMLSEMENLI